MVLFDPPVYISLDLLDFIGVPALAESANSHLTTTRFVDHDELASFPGVGRVCQRFVF